MKKEFIYITRMRPFDFKRNLERAFSRSFLVPYPPLRRIILNFSNMKLFKKKTPLLQNIKRHSLGFSVICGPVRG